MTDVLSDVLRAVHLTGAVYFNFELSSPWALAAPPSREIAAAMMPGSQHVIEYHLMARGTGWGWEVGGPPVALAEGDLILFPQGSAHVLSSAAELEVEPELGTFDGPRVPLPIAHQVGGGGPQRARVVCCFLGCDDRPFNPLLGALPAMIHLGAGPATGWLPTLMNIAVSESASGRAGSENVLARLSELMFVEAIRRYLETLPPSQAGWLAGLRDPVVGRALATLHGQPSEAWTVESLARQVGVSRSVLAERFAEMVGHPPMQYLALWRMQLATRLLSDGEPVASAAAAVGYESVAAFSRGFKKVVGRTPGDWRRGPKESLPG